MRTAAWHWTTKPRSARSSRGQSQEELDVAGSDAGGETLADAMTPVETANMSGRNPEAYLADVLARIADHINPRLVELLPWNRATE